MYLFISFICTYFFLLKKIPYNLQKRPTDYFHIFICLFYLFALHTNSLANASGVCRTWARKTNILFVGEEFSLFFLPLLLPAQMAPVVHLCASDKLPSAAHNTASPPMCLANRKIFGMAVKYTPPMLRGFGCDIAFFFPGCVYSKTKISWHLIVDGA